MEDVICDISAFNYYRVPPQVLGLYPVLPAAVDDPNHNKKLLSPLATDILRLPIHRLIDDRQKRTGARRYRSHLFGGELPFGSVRQTPHDFSIASPALTLFTLSRRVSRYTLLKAMYEMCGSFSIYTPPQHIASLLTKDNERKASEAMGSAPWEQVSAHDGKPTNLWKRAPLVMPDELVSYAESLRPVNGYRNFLECARLVSGITASPFEAQLSLLLSLPRKFGGYGISCFENNQKIRLTKAARLLSGKRTCYADLLFEQGDMDKQLILEAQGATVHNNDRSALLDADRATGLQSMGYNVVMVTYEQLRDEQRFDALADLVLKELGMKRPSWNGKQLKARSELRRHILGSWDEL